MKRACLLLLFALAPAFGQTSPFTLYIHDTTGVLPDAPLPSLYQMASTAVGSNSPTVVKMVNTSTDNVYFVAPVIATSTTSSAVNSDFSVTGYFEDEILYPGSSILFTMNFAPTSVGVKTGYLNLAYQIQQGGCVFSGSGTICPANLTNVSILNGTATAPLLTLSYQTPSGPVTLSPSSSSPLNFPNTSLSSTSTITFILTNSSTVSTTVPAITLPVINTNLATDFSLNTAALPTTIAAGQSANFTVTFAPTQLGIIPGELQVGTNDYPLQGAGIVVATIDSLLISFTDSTGAGVLPSPISFGQVLPGSGASAVLTVTVQNPTTSANSVNISAITVSGSGFSLARLPTFPAVLGVGGSLTFTVAFTPLSSGAFTGILTIGSRTPYALAGVGIASSVPSLTLTTNPAQITSAEQVTLSIQLSAASPVAALGTIKLAFAPSVVGVTDDAAIVFHDTGGRLLNISLSAGAQTAVLSDGSPLTFATGTTAGTITFTVSFPNTTPYTQSFVIAPAIAQLTTSQATRENPNLLVTASGYDNTYSASQLSFTFYDTSGNQIGSPVQYNAASGFQNLFFTNNLKGGTFTFSASFPVLTGDITKVGSVTVGVTNSAGQSSNSVTFQ